MLKLYLCTYVLLESDESSYYYQEFEDPNYKDFRAEANLQAELRNQRQLLLGKASKVNWQAFMLNR